ncbi:hypothetical protein [Deinococcus sp. SL84]|uniref:hypothetical protein n=1 Tax=Deinococcus sp. SL84 TaxID=2994663 RepID=UPI002273896F|nr:hypothetical protein [Deinococcus sp. SL84]MCY1703862.1 hypothetical protein [Deinococcus sp. SL84]
MQRLQADRGLKSLAHVQTIEGVQATLVHALAGEEREVSQDEVQRVTAALLMTLAKLDKPQSDALHREMTLRPHLEQQFPTIGEAVRSTRQRREAPLALGAADVQDVLKRAGQLQAGLTIGADGRRQLTGPFQIHLNVGGANIPRLQQWLNEPGEEQIRLSPFDGHLEMTLGDPELDAMVFPGELSYFTLERKAKQLGARLKIQAGAEVKFIDAQMAIKPHSQRMTLAIGHERCRAVLELDFATSKGKMNLTTAYGDQVPPEEDRALFEAVSLLCQPESQLQVLKVKDPESGETRLERPAKLLEMGHKGNTAGMKLIADTHLAALDVVKLLTSMGVDPEELLLPSVPLDDALFAFRWLLDAANGKNVGQPGAVAAVIEVPLAELGYGNQVAEMRPVLDLGFGNVGVRLEQEMLDPVLTERPLPDREDGVQLVVEGTWGQPRLEVLTAEDGGQSTEGEAEQAGWPSNMRGPLSGAPL